MTWTTPAHVKEKMQRLWDRGLLLAALAGGELLFPKRLTLRGPDSRELSERFPEVRDWITQLSGMAGSCRIEWRSVNHRILGTNDIPSAIWIDTLQDALELIGMQKAAGRFAALVDLTEKKQPELIQWLTKRPLRTLELAEDWAHLLEIVDWVARHPRPSIYLRQIDLPGVHSKLIEKHRGVLGELLDLVLPGESIDTAHTGVGGFCRRYGFLDKPQRVRFRVLDQSIRLLNKVVDMDFTLTREAFASLDLPVSRVFITENEVNFLAFPKVRDALVIFGAGYGFAGLAGVTWLNGKSICYWGDIDTHGFAILNQLRGILPHAVSFLMDQETLFAHRSLWGVEAQPETGALSRLNPQEAALYDRLRHNDWRDRVRLEQERIGFDYLCKALTRL